MPTRGEGGGNSPSVQGGVLNSPPALSLAAAGDAVVFPLAMPPPASSSGLALCDARGVPTSNRPPVLQPHRRRAFSPARGVEPAPSDPPSPRGTDAVGVEGASSRRPSIAVRSEERRRVKIRLQPRRSVGEVSADRRCRHSLAPPPHPRTSRTAQTTAIQDGGGYRSSPGRTSTSSLTTSRVAVAAHT